MKSLKKILFACSALALVSFAYAQDFGDDFSDGYLSYDEPAEPSVTIGGSVEVNARAYVEASEYKYITEKDILTGKDKEPELGFEDRPSFGEIKTAAFPAARLNLDYSGANSDLYLKLKFDKTSLYDGYYWDILDEFTARVYVGNAQFEAGKMKLVWGKGDKLHVLDNFNANDYLDYIIPDYIDRRIAEPMFRAVYSTNNNVKLEAVYTPMMTADRLASDGVWQPKATKVLTHTVEGLVTSTVTDVSSLLAASNFKSDSLYPDTQKLKYSQYGGRVTFTAGSVDLGFSYYYGHNKQPSANLEAIVNKEASNVMLKKIDGLSPMLSKIDPALTLVVPALKARLNRYNYSFLDYVNSKDYTSMLDYDMMQVFGFEAAAVLFGRFNSRLEAAYNLTEDIAGDDPWVHNNSIGWVAGFDMDLPVHNVNINVQNQGSYILNNHKIGSESFRPFAQDKDLLKASPMAYVLANALFKASYGDYDVDYDPTGCYTNNKIVVDITDTWNHEKIKLDLKGIWGIERGDVIVMPTLTFNVKDDWNLNLSGMYIWCRSEDSEFDGWQRNSFAQVGVKYQF